MTPSERLALIEGYVREVLKDEDQGTLPGWFSAATVASRVFYMITAAAGRTDDDDELD